MRLPDPCQHFRDGAGLDLVELEPRTRTPSSELQRQEQNESRSRGNDVAQKRAGTNYWLSCSEKVDWKIGTMRRAAPKSGPLPSAFRAEPAM